MSMDRPHEADTFTDRPTTTDPNSRLAALHARAKAHHLDSELTAHGLLVTNPQVDACCAAPGKKLSDMITCRPYDEDGGRLWFFTSWQQPIAEADNLTDAIVQIKGYLSDRKGITHERSGITDA